jgi:hypothetical protein
MYNKASLINFLSNHQKCVIDSSSGTDKTWNSKLILKEGVTNTDDSATEYTKPDLRD